MSLGKGLGLKATEALHVAIPAGDQCSVKVKAPILSAVCKRVLDCRGCFLPASGKLRKREGIVCENITSLCDLSLAQAQCLSCIAVARREIPAVTFRALQ